MIIGICGKSGSGKSTLATKIKNKVNNSVILEIDKIGHNSLKNNKVKEDIINTFGYSVISNNEVDRKKLNKIVFSSKIEMNKLTEITWKYMQNEINILLENNKENTVILDWQLLPKTEFFNMCEIKILMNIPYEIRKERAMNRDNISKTEFDLREQASYNYNKDSFDYIINENNLEEILNTTLSKIIK